MSTKERIQEMKNSRLAKNARMHASMCIPKDKDEIVHVSAVVGLPTAVMIAVGAPVASVVGIAVLAAGVAAAEMHLKHSK